VTALISDGVDPHLYKPTRDDVAKLLNADVIFYSGLHLEGKLTDLLERLGRSRPVVLVGDSLPEADLITVGGGLFDPHVWFDARLWSRGAAPVAEALAAADPAHADEHRDRAAAYAARLVALDERLRTQIADIPEGRRVLVTAHDAFRYFGRAYGIEVVGVQGTSTESEAGLADINRLVDLVVSRGIPAVFIETSVSDRSVAALREGARARGHDVGVGGTLYSDSLGGPGSGAETLEAALEANMAAIVAALTDEPAPRGKDAP
jgi:manganese/zinc/iron transport system substrate-binding protein